MNILVTGFLEDYCILKENGSDININDKSLFDMVKRTLQGDNSMIAFSDNSVL